MWSLLISVFFFLANLNLSLLTTVNKYSNYQQIRLESTDDHTDTYSNCSSISTNIDTSRNKLDHDDQRQDYLPMVTNSFWKQILVETDDDDDESEETDHHSIVLNNVQVIFDIPYPISNGTILNQTAFIIDTIHNQLIGFITHMCINESSFIINYSTNKPFPHNVCLYLLLNISSSIPLKEIYICRIINKNLSSAHNHIFVNNSLKPGAIFIIAQGAISLLMMLLICMVHSVKDKHYVHRVGQHLCHNRLVSKTTDSEITNDIHLNNFIAEQVLSTANLTSIHKDRKFTNHTLIDVKEFTKRLSISHKNNESYVF